MSTTTIKKYIKDNIVYELGTILKYDNKLIINPTEDLLLSLGFVEYVETLSELELIEQARIAKLNEIVAYDTSDNVNLFYLGEQELWIPRETRVSLMNSTTILKEMGLEITTFWFNNLSFTLPIDTALEMLKTLEVYALQCYNATAIHKHNVSLLTTLEEILEYDYTSGYPDKIHL